MIKNSHVHSFRSRVYFHYYPAIVILLQAIFTGRFLLFTRRLLQSDFHSISQRLLRALILKKAPINAKNSMPARDRPWGGLQVGRVARN